MFILRIKIRSTTTTEEDLRTASKILRTSRTVPVCNRKMAIRRTGECAGQENRWRCPLLRQRSMRESESEE